MYKSTFAHKELKKKTWAEFLNHYLQEAYKADNDGNLEGFNLWLVSPLSRQEVAIASCNADDEYYDLIKED